MLPTQNELDDGLAPDHYSTVPVTLTLVGAPSRVANPRCQRLLYAASTTRGAR